MPDFVFAVEGGAFQVDGADLQRMVEIARGAKYMPPSAVGCTWKIGPWLMQARETADGRIFFKIAADETTNDQG